MKPFVADSSRSGDGSGGDDDGCGEAVSLRRRLLWTRQIALAVQYLHREDFVHSECVVSRSHHAWGCACKQRASECVLRGGPAALSGGWIGRAAAAVPADAFGVANDNVQFAVAATGAMHGLLLRSAFTGLAGWLLFDLCVGLAGDLKPQNVLINGDDWHCLVRKDTANRFGCLIVLSVVRETDSLRAAPRGDAAHWARTVLQCARVYVRARVRA